MESRSVGRRPIWGVFVFLATLASGTAMAGAELQWKVLAELDRFEPFEAQTFHAGLLWSGRSRKDMAADYHLDVFDRSGNAVASATLSHSLRFLYPYGPNSVIAVGISSATQLSHYTIATWANGRLKLQSAKIPLGALADEWAGRPGRMYFTDPGGLDDGSPIGQPLRTLFTLSGFGTRFLNARIPGPHRPLLVGNSLFLVEHPSIASGGKYVVRVNLSGETAERVYTGSGITDLRLSNDGRSLLVADRESRELLRLDVTSAKLVQRLSVSGGSPRVVRELGHCLVAGLETERRVLFLDGEKGAVVSEWDVSGVGTRFTGIRNLSVDSETGALFLRSAYAANPVAPGGAERNSVVRVEEPSGKTLAACLR